MEQTKVSRKQVALFFNGENENRSFIAKQWLIKQILFEKSIVTGIFILLIFVMKIIVPMISLAFAAVCLFLR